MPSDPFVLGQDRKIDPTRRPVSLFETLPDGTPNDVNRVEIGPTDMAFREWEDAGLTPPQMPALREYRLGRLVAELQKRDVAGLLMFDPLNIRYATDSANMQIWIAHNPCRACLVTADGYLVLWDFHSGEHLSAHLPLISEIREGGGFFYFQSGERTEQHARLFAAQVDEVMRARAGTSRRLAVDRIEIAGLRALDDLGFQISDGQEVTEHARKVKNANELNAMRCAVAACENAMSEMQSALVPGITEVEAWAELQRGNYIRGGEWIETRILSSGPRTNPWFQECGPRFIEDGDIFAFDTDMIGPYGYCADLSRTWKVGGQAPTAYEADLFQSAVDFIEFNKAQLKPGRSFRELAEASQAHPEKFNKRRYSVLFHGVGLCDEYPAIRYPDNWESAGYDGILEPGMCLCAEVYFGEVGGPCGIKLEDQLVITEFGAETISTFPLALR